MQTAALPFRYRLLLLLTWAMAGLSAAAAPRIPPLTIAIAPAKVCLRPGDTAILSAHASGGEAIRLIIEWRIDEGSNGGYLELLEERANGEASARYTAPLDGNGKYHVSAQLRGFPAVRASAVISVDEKCSDAN